MLASPSRLSALFFAVLSMVACSGSHTRDADRPMTPAPSGGGVCCPIDDHPCEGPDVPAGGWAARPADCADHTLGVWDGAWDRGSDSHGCPIWIDRYPAASGGVDVCCGCYPVDAGPPEDTGPSGLEGDYACGSFTCGTGEVCLVVHSGADTGMAAVPRCVTAPAACELRDCNDAFGERTCCQPDDACARELCGLSACTPGGGWGGVGVSGRRVECFGI